MPCKCKKKVEDTMKETDIGPKDFCMLCAQKHFLAAEHAVKEFGYKDSEKNHNYAIGELGLAVDHIKADFPVMAQKIRDIRHFVQYWEYDRITTWDEIAHEMNVEIRKTISGKKPEKATKIPGTIYIFSNVKYPEERKIKAQPGDILVFLNKGESVRYYLDAPVPRFLYHRSQKECYGEFNPHCINMYVFDEEKKGNCIPKEFINKLKETYDWNYETEEYETEKTENGEIRKRKIIKCMTTGYMVVKWFESRYPGRKIVLVNFGYEVQHSTYRCPWHNWKFEAEALKGFEHVFLEEEKADAGSSDQGNKSSGA